MPTQPNPDVTVTPEAVIEAAREKCPAMSTWELRYYGAGDGARWWTFTAWSLNQLGPLVQVSEYDLPALLAKLKEQQT